MWWKKKKKGELDKELGEKSTSSLIGALFLNPGAISYLFSKRKLRKLKADKNPRYTAYQRIEKIK